MTEPTIICGDNVEVMRGMAAESIDLVVTSPPYDNLRTYGGHSWDFEGVANELWRLIKPGGVVVWVVADQTIDGSESGESFRQALRFKEIGFRLHDTMIWENDCCPFPEFTRYYSAFEFMFVLSKGQPTTTNLISDRKNKHGGTKVHGTERQKDGTTATINAVANGIKRAINDVGIRFNVWRIAKAGKANNKHPASFPQALARDHILSWSNEGDLVLDPFAGSFTTCRAAYDNGRESIGIEANPDYCEIGRKRLRQGVLGFDA